MGCADNTITDSELAFQGERMQSWLIDENGEACPEETAIADRVPPHADIEQDGAAHFLMCSAGYVRIIIGSRIVKVVFWEEHVAKAALIGALFFLTERRLSKNLPDAVAIVDLCSDPQITMCRDTETWTRLLGDVAERKANKTLRFSRSIPLAMSPFYDRVAAGREIVQVVASDVDRNHILNTLFQGMFMLVRQDRDDGSLSILEMGTALKRYDDSVARRFRGRRLVDGPDQSYGSWVETHYSKSLDRDETLADDVDATIAWTAQQPIIHRYSRVVIPIKRDVSERWLLSVTKLR